VAHKGKSIHTPLVGDRVFVKANITRGDQRGDSPMRGTCWASECDCVDFLHWWKVFQLFLHVRLISKNWLSIV